MLDAQQTLDGYWLEMRWRALSLAADFDRVQRATGGTEVLRHDPRIVALREALAIVLGELPQRAERLEMLLSDRSAPPAR